MTKGAVVACNACKSPLYEYQANARVGDMVQAKDFKPVHPQIPQPQPHDPMLCPLYWCGKPIFVTNNCGVQFRTPEGELFPKLDFKKDL